MNTAINETQKPKKNFPSDMKDSNFSDKDNSETQRDMKSRDTSGSKDVAPSSSAKSNSPERSSDESGKVASMKKSDESTTQAKGEASGKSESQGKGEVQVKGEVESKSGDEEKKSEKSPGFFEQLDLALIDASISIGDVTKKIDALAPKEGGIAKISKFTSEKLGALQTYLGDNTSKAILAGAWGLVRRSPWPVGLAVVGAGIGLYIQAKTAVSDAVEEKSVKAAS